MRMCEKENNIPINMFRIYIPRMEIKFMNPNLEIGEAKFILHANWKNNYKNSVNCNAPSRLLGSIQISHLKESKKRRLVASVPLQFLFFNPIT